MKVAKVLPIFYVIILASGSNLLVQKMHIEIAKLMSKQQSRGSGVVYFLGGNDSDELIGEAHRAQVVLEVVANNSHDFSPSGITISLGLPDGFQLSDSMYTHEIFIVDLNCSKNSRYNDVFWKRGNRKIATICVVKDIIYLYKHQWNLNRECEGENFLAIFNVDNVTSGAFIKWLEWPKTFSKSCPVEAILTRRPPVAMILNGRPSGYEALILQDSFTKININFLEINSSLIPGLSIKKLFQNEDILGGMAVCPNHPIVACTHTGFYTKLVAVTPYIPKKHFSVVYDIFSPTALFAIIGCNFFYMIATLIFNTWVMKYDICTALGKSCSVLSLLVGQPSRAVRSQTVYWYSMWLIYAFVITSWNHVGLSLHLTSQKNKSQFERLDDLEKINNISFKFVCREPLVKVVAQRFPHIKDQLKILPFSSPPSIILNQIIDEKNIVLFEYEEIVLFEISKMSMENKEKIKILVPGLKIISTVFITPKNYYLKEHLKKKIDIFTAAGFIVPLRNSWLYFLKRNNTQPSAKFRPVSFEDVCDIFFLGIEFFKIAMVLFVAEIVWYKIQCRRKNKLRKRRQRYNLKIFHVGNYVGPRRI